MNSHYVITQNSTIHSSTNLPCTIIRLNQRACCVTCLSSQTNTLLRVRIALIPRRIANYRPRLMVLINRIKTCFAGKHIVIHVFPTKVRDPTASIVTAIDFTAISFLNRNDYDLRTCSNYGQRIQTSSPNTTSKERNMPTKNISLVKNRHCSRISQETASGISSG